MSGERTEAPTPHRLREARRKGQVAKSVEVNSAAILLLAFWLLSIIGSWMIAVINSLMTESFASMAMPDLSLNTVQLGGLTLALKFSQALGPLLIALLFIGILANVIQVGFLFSLQALRPDPSRINPLNGLKRIFSERGLVELVKSLLKLAIIGIVVYLSLRDNAETIAASSRLSLSQTLANLVTTGRSIGLRVAGTILVIAVADYLFQRRAHTKSLRMSKQEIREEMKRFENPQLKARIRARQRQIAVNRMMAAVPESDVVITNPTHFAVVLRYDQAKMDAPQVVAKGQRLMAQRLKKLAREHEIPIVENKPLARTLFQKVEINQFVPADLYQAVAEILAFVYRLKPGPRKAEHV